jgi:hypothetical protein
MLGLGIRCACVVYIPALSIGSALLKLDNPFVKLQPIIAIDFSAALMSRDNPYFHFEKISDLAIVSLINDGFVGLFVASRLEDYC